MKSWNGVIRPLTYDDLDSFIGLETRIWSPLGVETATPELFHLWSSEGILLGCFDAGTTLVGYAYCEVISFSRIPPYSTALLRTLESYRVSNHDPQGNALHGVSMATEKPGAGEALLASLLEEARRLKLRYFVSLARLSGLGRFIEDNSLALREYDLPLIATLYAIEAVSWIDPALIGSPLALIEIPQDFPKLKRKDRVVTRFSRLGKELWGVARSSFEDLPSHSYSALLVLPLSGAD